MDRFESKLDDASREVRSQTWKLMTVMIAVVAAAVVAVVGRGGPSLTPPCTRTYVRVE